jgi:hypothetical protein
MTGVAIAAHRHQSPRRRRPPKAESEGVSNGCCAREERTAIRKASTAIGKALLAGAQCPTQAVEATPLGKKTFLETSRGEPVSSKCFGDWLRDRRDEAGLRQCMAYPPGVRRRLSRPENGAMILHCLAVLGWVTAVTTHYIKDRLVKARATPSAGSLRTDRGEADETSRVKDIPRGTRGDYDLAADRSGRLDSTSGRCDDLSMTEGVLVCNGRSAHPAAPYRKTK